MYTNVCKYKNGPIGSIAVNPIAERSSFKSHQQYVNTR